MRIFRTLILLVILIAAAPGCRENVQAPDGGAPAGLRIASLSPAISIILEDLGLADQIVGRHGSDQSLDRSIPVVGDQSGLDYETLARLEPTHVLLQTSAADPPDLLEEIASKRGWTVVAIPLLSLDEISDGVRTLSETFAEHDGVLEKANALLDRMGAAWSDRLGLGRRAGMTLCVYWVSPIGVAGPGSFHHDLLKRMGIHALPEEGSAYITLDREDLKRLNPDSILILTPDIDAESLAEALSPWRDLGVTAVDQGRVEVLSDWRFLTPSTAMIDLADRIASVVSVWTPVEPIDAETPDANLQTK